MCAICDGFFNKVLRECRSCRLLDWYDFGFNETTGEIMFSATLKPDGAVNAFIRPIKLEENEYYNGEHIRVEAVIIFECQGDANYGLYGVVTAEELANTLTNIMKLEKKSPRHTNCFAIPYKAERDSDTGVVLRTLFDGFEIETYGGGVVDCDVRNGYMNGFEFRLENKE